MGKILIIAEKPSVARDIAKVLKVSGKGDGFLFSDTHLVSWAVGHLVTLCEPEDYDLKLKRWDIKTLPFVPEEIKLKGIESTKKQLVILKNLMNSKDVDYIICATDSGREGELIFRYIYNIVKCKKMFKRLWISSMTDSAIKDGFDKLKDGSYYDNLYISAKCRSEADWLVGINATRAYTLKYNTLLSIGRVQTPTLAILVERQKEINSFVPQEYFEVKADFESYFGLWFSQKDNESKILEKNKASSIIEKVTGQKGKITNIENEEKKQPPSLLYDLTELQRDCNRKFGFSAQKTLSLAQDLYEKRKLITYPRTDSRYLSDDMMPKIESTLHKLCIDKYKPFAEYVLSLSKLPISKRIIDNSKVTDHHAIIPTDTNINLKALSAEELKVYDLVARKFISVFYPYYIYNITRICSEVCDESFITKGTTIIQLGYMELYKEDKDTNKEKGEEETDILPNVNVGDEIFLRSAELLQKKTKPPKAYTEGTLLSAMENAGRFVSDEVLKEQLKESGIGTPSTRAATIERLLEVGYITRNKKALIPSEKGMKLIEIVPTELKSPETTGKWEKGLNLISKGEMDSLKFMGSIVRYVNFIVESSQKSQTSVVFPEDSTKKPSKLKSLGKCPKCGAGEIFENTKAYYCGHWKNGCKFTIWKNSLEKYGSILNNDIIKNLLSNKKIEKINITMPQTLEKCTADLVFKEDFTCVILINVNRLKSIK